jgi:hypothetical protein
MVKKKKTEGSVNIQLPRPNLQTIKLIIIGDTSLIQNRFSERKIQGLEDTHTHKAKGKRGAKNPEREFKEALYMMPGNKYGHPATGFKNGAIDACRYVDYLSMVEAKGAFQVLGDLIEIKGSKPEMRRDPVRNRSGVPDLRYRPEFKDWQCELTIRFNANAVSPEQLVHLFDLAGFHVGIGEWRPMGKEGKGGSHGMFHVARGDE